MSTRCGQVIMDDAQCIGCGDGESELAAEIAPPACLVGCGVEQLLGRRPVGGAVAGVKPGGLGGEVAC